MMFNKIIVLIIAAILVVCSAEGKACKKHGFYVATTRDGKSILCGKGADEASKCPGSDKELGYCDIKSSVCCIKNLDCSKKKCSKGTVCVEEKDNNGVVLAKCVPHPTTTTTPTPSPSTPCDGVIDRGICYDRLCRPVRGRSRLQKTLKLKCESKPGHACVRVGKSVRCVEKRISTRTQVPSSVMSSSTTSTTVAVTPTPAVVKTYCKDEDEKMKEDKTEGDKKEGDKKASKCPKRFVNTGGKCIHKKCITRSDGANKCEKDGKHYCMKDKMGRIDCQTCPAGLEKNGSCIVEECIKSDTDAITECKQHGGECKRVGRTIMCLDDDDKEPQHTNKKSACLFKEKSKTNDGDVKEGNSKKGGDTDNDGEEDKNIKKNGRGNRKKDKDGNKDDDKDDNKVDDKDDDKNDNKDDDKTYDKEDNKDDDKDEDKDENKDDKDNYKDYDDYEYEDNTKNKKKHGKN